MTPVNEAPLIPIVVEGTGRDGTTLTMQLLGTSAAIAFDRTYPFEQRYLTYMLSVAQMIERDEWDEERWNRDLLNNTARLVNEQGLVGPPPWKDRRLLAPNAGHLPPLRKRVYQLLWREFSQRARTAMREEMERPDLEVTYYAQKASLARARGLEDVPVVKLLPLLRDPRDTWLSHVAFHEKRVARGGRGFSRLKEGVSKSEYLSRFIGGQRRRMDWLLNLGDEALIVRYENLITDLPGEAERLGRWLGVRLHPRLALDRSKGLKERHMTSSSAEESIGRWKREMSEEVAARFQRELGGRLQAHGYDS
jgi:hypothetical protein